MRDWKGGQIRKRLPGGRVRHGARRQKRDRQQRIGCQARKCLPPGRTILRRGKPPEREHQGQAGGDDANHLKGQQPMAANKQYGHRQQITHLRALFRRRHSKPRRPAKPPQHRPQQQKPHGIGQCGDA